MRASEGWSWRLMKGSKSGVSCSCPMLPPAAHRYTVPASGAAPTTTPAPVNGDDSVAYVELPFPFKMFCTVSSSSHWHA